MTDESTIEPVSEDQAPDQASAPTPPPGDQPGAEAAAPDAGAETSEEDEGPSPVEMLGIKRMSLQELKEKTATDLLAFAEALELENANSMRRQDMMFSILKTLAEGGVEISGSGTLEVLQDGFGFLRSPEANYLPGPDDIYVSPSQIRRFGLRTGDTVEGQIRSPKEGERYFALLKVNTINFEDPDKARHKVSNRGVLWEYQQPGHDGIDHIWHDARLPFGYRITDTKGTGSARHRLMTPKAFYDLARQGIDIFMAMEDETSIRNATPRSTVGDGKEMSHTWVVRKVGQAGLTGEHRRALQRSVEQWRRNFNKNDEGVWKLSGRAPYDRTFVTVVKSNLDLHDKSNGGDLPKCSRPVRVHQIAAEFILPTEIYFE